MGLIGNNYVPLASHPKSCSYSTRFQHKRLKVLQGFSDNNCVFFKVILFSYPGDPGVGMVPGLGNRSRDIGMGGQRKMDGSCIELCRENSGAALTACINKVIQNGAASLIILACDADRWTPERADNVFKGLPVPIVGGVFPSIIHEGRRLDSGTLVIGLPCTVSMHVIHGLSSAPEAAEKALRNLASPNMGCKSLITLVDGLANHIERFVESLYGMVGLGVEVIGCGAGSLDLVQKPCLFTGDGLLQDAAVIIALPASLRRGVRHGWEVLDGPYLVTSSTGNVLETLNYQPAFDVYRETVESASGLHFEGNDFFSVAKTYPFGIEYLDGDILVRDPIRVNGQSLVFVGEIPENAMVYVLKGRTDRLIASAGQAAAEAHRAYLEETGREPGQALVFDCISRALLLGEDFPRELDSIRHALGEEQQMSGALTLGEITNTRNGPFSLLNKSTVIGVF